MKKNKNTFTGCNIEISCPIIIKNENGYDNKDWKIEDCTDAIYLDPETFSEQD
jgi:hypothetical protein